MKALICIAASVATLIGVFVNTGGSLTTLNVPGEYFMITMFTLISIILSCDKEMISSLSMDLKASMTGGRFNKSLCIDMISNMYFLLATHKKDGSAGIEEIISSYESGNFLSNSLFFKKNYQYQGIIIDYLRLYILDSSKASDYIASIGKDYAKYAASRKHANDTISAIIESIPGLGIVVAVLGIIKALGVIDGPMDILGHMVAEALVGTMFGVWVCYCILSPLSSNMGKHMKDELLVYESLLVILIAHIKGSSPIISLELGRRVLPIKMRPEFQDIEKATINNL